MTHGTQPFDAKAEIERLQKYAEAIDSRCAAIESSLLIAILETCGSCGLDGELVVTHIQYVATAAVREPEIQRHLKSFAARLHEKLQAPRPE